MMATNWRPLFFSGGTALRELAQEMAANQVNSIHIVSTFDSGGSSARLRECFGMPAIGDLRNRLLALADRQRAAPAALNLFSMRLPLEISRFEAQEALVKLLANSKNWRSMPEETACLLRRSLQIFRERMPGGFDARGACIGNLMLAGSYLENGRDLGAALSVFSAIFHIRGSILPLCAASLHLGAILENGRIIIGQHLFHDPPAAIKEIFLSVKGEAEDCAPIACLPQPCAGVLDAPFRANLICLPMGSFFSSVLTHLMPAGVAGAIMRSPAPKVFVPNSGNDPELRNVDLEAQLGHILRHAEGRQGKMLDYVLVDRKNGQYQTRAWPRLEDWLARRGIRLIDRSIVDAGNPQRHLPGALMQALLDLSRPFA